MQSKRVELKNSKNSNIVDILSELSDVELWMYKWASPEIVNKKFSPIRKKVLALSD